MMKDEELQCHDIVCDDARVDNTQKACGLKVGRHLKLQLMLLPSLTLLTLPRYSVVQLITTHSLAVRAR